MPAGCNAGDSPCRVRPQGSLRAPVHPWSHPPLTPELARKIPRIRVANGMRDFTNIERLRAQQCTGIFNALAINVLTECFALLLMKSMRQVIRSTGQHLGQAAHIKSLSINAAVLVNSTGLRENPPAPPPHRQFLATHSGQSQMPAQGAGQAGDPFHVRARERHHPPTWMNPPD